MKKLTIVLLILIGSFSLHSQPIIGLGLGYGITGKSVAAEFQTGYHFNRADTLNHNTFSLNVGWNAYTDSRNPFTISGRLGREFMVTQLWSIKAMAGSGYQLATERKPKSTFVPAYGIEIIKYPEYDSKSCLFLGFNQLGRYSVITFGVRGLIR